MEDYSALSESFLIDSLEVDTPQETVNEILGSINSIPDDETLEEEKLRRKLKFYFMNPIKKWYHKQRLPYKFFVQVFKIIFVTLQSCIFAHYRCFHVDYVWNNRVTFSHLFLQGWDPSREIVSYPPQLGDMAIYKASEFFSAIDFAVVAYGNLDEAVGSYAYPKDNNTIGPILFCYDHFKTCNIFGFNESYVFDNEIMRDCVEINITKKEVANFSSENFFREKNVLANFSSFVEGFLSFEIKTVNLNSPVPTTPPDCYKFNLTLNFDNQAHDGKIKLSLSFSTTRLHCSGKFKYTYTTHFESILQSIINVTVIAICGLSAILCGRSVYRAQMLRRKTAAFFKKHFNRDLSKEGKLEFIDAWYLTMITSDFIVILGSSLKEKIEMNEFSGDEWNICSVLLGTGTFLIWFCVLRYLSFFRTYNVVILTLKVATPVIFRFMVCALIIYSGFVFCGWLVLGPYHMKFRTLSGTSECLFSLINGDDMFATFSALLPTKSSLLWWFCRIYLYFFICLFIYVILSLFVSVILDAYETIKRYSLEGFPKNEIQEFIEGSSGNPIVDIMCESSSSLGDDLVGCEGRRTYKNLFYKFFCRQNL